jgi:hypothetical protein
MSGQGREQLLELAHEARQLPWWSSYASPLVRGLTLDHIERGGLAAVNGLLTHH